MNVKSQKNLDHVRPGQPASAPIDLGQHPAWCDPARCTADPASQAHGFRSGVGGQHHSAPVSLSLAAALWLPARHATAWLSEACAPWKCAVHLHIKAGDEELSMPLDHAAPVLDALVTLLASALTAPEVTR